MSERQGFYGDKVVSQNNGNGQRQRQQVLSFRELPLGLQEQLKRSAPKPDKLSKAALLAWWSNFVQEHRSSKFNPSQVPEEVVRDILGAAFEAKKNQREKKKYQQLVAATSTSPYDKIGVL